ncbi:hypothetical protein N7468_006610 [Penicillium chermesinum]|uniref:Uncharacterized protein n=1 Tax=Penicillium chermesinum TaxID=63820 RepID=A0A9W9NSM4_9EURO|nr:uncharacterized protein N7468_006610 [Penicillium chermesinum]KAJ5225385.1 hypothetical protein N7468_006610 [Penicillium chermesinum]
MASWLASDCCLNGSILPEHAEQHPGVLEIRGKGTTKDTMEANAIPLVISGCSAPFRLGSEPAEKLILRELTLASSHTATLRIWEETGNSIARHIWLVPPTKTPEPISHHCRVGRDAALASVIFLDQTITSETTARLPALSKLLHQPRGPPLQAVELGAGCGIVGIALASMLDSCEVLLTDLPEVEEIVQRNLAEAHLKKSSSVSYQNLDWDEPPLQFCRKRIDLILVSDCTYNADSLPALVSVLDKLTRSSPEALVLVALKRRHESEAVFFDLMQSAEFTGEQASMDMPAQNDQVDKIELHCYRKVTCHRSG